MSQQFRIDSEALRDKINTLLPSQARGAINVDLSGQTTIVPIVDLTETAEGSSLRQDLQTASTINTTTVTAENTTTTVTNTTGYYFLHVSFVLPSRTDTNLVAIQITDGVTTTDIFKVQAVSSASAQDEMFGNKTIIARVSAGETLQITSPNTSCRITCSSNQIADINGNLTNV